MFRVYYKELPPCNELGQLEMKKEMNHSLDRPSRGVFPIPPRCVCPERDRVPLAPLPLHYRRRPYRLGLSGRWPCSPCSTATSPSPTCADGRLSSYAPLSPTTHPQAPWAQTGASPTAIVIKWKGSRQVIIPYRHPHEPLSFSPSRSTSRHPDLDFAAT